MTRRGILSAALLVVAGPTMAERDEQIEVWREPNCGCCSNWIAHLRKSGFSVEDRVVASVAPIRRMLGTPPDLLSCHAARVAGLVLEGHVPALAIRRLLTERPAGILGLAVPSMPIGSPGMEVPQQRPDTYDVIGWRADATRETFMRFVGDQPV